VRKEDSSELARTGLQFNLHAIIGGRLSHDLRPSMFLIYPEGNWIEVNADSPFFVIGRTSMASPLLVRHLTYDTSLAEAASLALVLFDLTTASASDVDYPIDVAVMPADSSALAVRRFERSQVADVTSSFRDGMARQFRALDTSWFDPLAHSTR
jgi:putative proteasome-type protease